jgi:hypothetical protein
MDLSMKEPAAAAAAAAARRPSLPGIAALIAAVALLFVAPPRSRAADDRNPQPFVPTDPKGELLRDSPGGPPRKFQPATKEEAADAIASFKKAAAEIENVLHVKFGTIETPHFLVFTDWDKREYDFLKTNVEGAYTTVSRQFEIPTSDNVFIGKLPVFMFASHDDFKKYANQIDEFDVPENVAGYYMGNTKGFGHMAMWKPDVQKAGGNVREAEKRWAYTLTHEFTHAFVARYRSNGFVPRWLNEGLAEVVASRQFPRPLVYPTVREEARKRKSIQPLFEQKSLLQADDYPVVQTVVEAMLAGDSRAFLRFFNDIKDGMKPDEALQKEYKVDNKGLEAAWRKYLAALK